MKVSGAVFQTKNITTNTADVFDAMYKGHHFYITTDHGFDKPKYEHLKRFCIDVWDNSTGMKAVSTYADHRNIKDAIREALIGSCLIKGN